MLEHWSFLLNDGDLTLTSMVDVVTVDTDPVEAEGESTLLTCQNKFNLLFLFYS